jgi:hypothetical protein
MTVALFKSKTQSQRRSKTPAPAVPKVFFEKPWTIVFRLASLRADWWSEYAACCHRAWLSRRRRLGIRRIESHLDRAIHSQLAHVLIGPRSNFSPISMAQMLHIKTIQ